MAKVGNIFRGLFKVIFTVAAMVLGALAVVLFATPFISGSVNSPISILNFTGTASITGFSMAFGGPLTFTFETQSSSQTADLATYGINPVMLVAFILLVLGILMMLVNLFKWKPGKSVALVGAFFLLAGAVLCFLPMTVAELSRLAEDSSSSTLKDMLDLYDGFSLAPGAIASGIMGIVGAVCGAIASLCKTK